ncbi:MAG: divalent-cation tolerance protein CutA [Pseudomonadota bacterium]
MNMTSPPLLLVQTTLSDQTAAQALAQDLIGQQLAVCAQLGPAVTSIYPWQGRIEQQAEVVLTLKSTPGALPALKTRLLAQHPYDVPELLVLPVIETHQDYLDWTQDWTEPSEQ